MDTLLKEKTKNPFLNFQSFRNISESNPYTQLVAVPENDVEFYNDSEKALYLLQSQGYLPKVFCITATEEEVFTVKSDKWDWNIYPVKNLEQLKRVPTEFINGIQLLLQNNVKIDGVAIAKPKPRENPSEVIKQEFFYSVKVVAKMVGVLILSVVTLIGSIGNTVVSSASMLEGPDPVLLVRVNNSWIEIGRWE